MVGITVLFKKIPPKTLTVPSPEAAPVEHVTMRPVTALSVHMLYIQAENAEACDWLQCYLNHGCDISGGGDGWETPK